MVETKVLDNVFKRIVQLGEHTNHIIHSAWFIDFKNPEDIRNGLLMRYKPEPTKNGAKDDPSKFPIAEVKMITEKARILDDIIYQLNICIYTNRRRSLLVQSWTSFRQGRKANKGLHRVKD